MSREERQGFPIRAALVNHGAMTPVDDAAPRDDAAPARTAGASAQGRTVTDREIDQDIPYGVRIAASWSWRVGLIILVAGALVWLLSKVSFLLIPVMVAALLAGLLSPAKNWLRRRRLPNGLAVAVTVLGFIGVIGGAS